MALSRLVAPGCILAVVLMSPVVMAEQGARGTPTPSVPTPPPPPAQTEIGPLEKRAAPVTPENPVPRRIHFVLPAYPPEAAGTGLVVTLTLKVTLDQKGAVAEARHTSWRASLAGSGSGGPPQLLQAFLKSAADAVRQWLYDPPISAPISLYVQLTFVPDVEASVAWHDASPPPARPGVVGGVAGGVLAGPAPPPPPPPPPFPGAVRVGGNVMAPRKIKDVKPVYPAIAQSARVSGIVILEATIGADGRVVDARVIRSIQLLDDAALEAVRQWEFTPTLLNGAPTPIIMSVTVNFQLDK